jgi:hypothetical protein
MRTDEAPTSQKNVLIGEDHQRSGRPMTKRAVYSDFCVITWSPTCIGSGAVKRDVGGEGQGGGRRDVPNLFIAAKPPTRKPREISRRGLVILWGVRKYERRLFVVFAYYSQCIHGKNGNDKAIVPYSR